MKSEKVKNHRWINLNKREAEKSEILAKDRRKKHQTWERNPKKENKEIKEYKRDPDWLVFTWRHSGHVGALKQKNFNDFFCSGHQHGRFVFCLLRLSGAGENQELKKGGH